VIGLRAEHPTSLSVLSARTPDQKTLRTPVSQAYRSYPSSAENRIFPVNRPVNYEFGGPLFTTDIALYAPLVLMVNVDMSRVLFIVALLSAGIFPSYAQRGPAYPSESNRGPAFPKSVGPSDKNQTNWVTGPQDNTPTDTYQQLWILQRRWDQLYGSPNSRVWRRSVD
jgi:hypothetical protein